MSSTRKIQIWTLATSLFVQLLLPNLATAATSGITSTTLNVQSGAGTLTISTPADALSGMQYGVIWASVQSSPNAGGISNVDRVGIRMYDPVGAVQMQPKKMLTHHWYNPSGVEYQWAVLALLAVAVLFLAVKQIILTKRLKKKSKKRSKK